MRILEAVSQPVVVAATYFSNFHHAASLNTTNPTVVKASGGIMGLLAIVHIGTSSTDVRFLKLYDKATAPSASDIPILTFAIYAGQQMDLVPSTGIQFKNGIAYRMTLNYADNDNNAIGANELYISVAYN